MSYTDDLEWLSNKLDHETVGEHIMCVSDCNTVWVLCFEVELCPETGNSHIVVIKFWLLE